HGAEYATALADAQRSGFAEADPSLDVGGFDAAHKLSILARLAFDPTLDFHSVKAATRGIEGVNAAMFAEQAGRGRTIRLIGSVEAVAGKWRAHVGPVSLPSDHPLVTAGPTNTMLFRGDPLGAVLLRGPGAGGGATASAVVADVRAAAAGVPGHTPVQRAAAMPAVNGADDTIEALVEAGASAVSSRPARVTRFPSRSPRPCLPDWRPTAGCTYLPVYLPPVRHG